jgi:DNA-binding transcriptional MerR regulator
MPTMCVLWFYETKSVIKTQRRSRTQYRKDPHSDNALWRWLKQFQDTGTVVAAIETVTPQMLENTCRETEYRLDILKSMKGAHVEGV